MQLTDYIMRYTVLDKTTCKNVVQQLDKEKWSKHTFVDYDDNFDDEIQKSPCLTLTKPTPVDKIVMDSLYDAIHEYVTIKGMPFFTKWAGYSNVKYNKYGVGNQMEKHADHIYSIFRNNAGIPKGIPILSIIGALNDDYEGGEIEMFKDTKINLKAGEVIIFPSVFLYPHKVCELTKGDRYSFVSWVY